MSSRVGDGAAISMEDIYRALLSDGRGAQHARGIVARRHWIHQAAAFDERTGEMLPGSIGHICKRIGAVDPDESPYKDRIFRICEHVESPLMEILAHLREQIRRSRAMLPIRKVRELDCGSFMALSRRPGRTVREKLADRPYLMAVERRWSVDTAENRLIKEFCSRLARLLEVRAEHLSDVSQLTEMSRRLESWLMQPAVNDIGRWENLPPNNVLIGHRDYRRVWDAWRWLQTVDDDSNRDHEERLEQWRTTLFWSMVVQLADNSSIRLLEQPVFPGYDTFAVNTALGPGPGLPEVHGLYCPRGTGKVVGRVIRLAVDRNGKGIGFAEAADGQQYFLHGSEFDPPREYDSLKIGDAIEFVPKDTGGRLPLAAGATPRKQDADFCLSVEPGGAIVLRLQDRESGRLTIQPGRGGVEVAGFGKHWSAEATPSDALRIATEVVAKVVDPKPPRRQEGLDGGVPVTGSRSGPCALDFCVLRPPYLLGDIESALPMRLLWQRWSTEGNESVEADVASARAVHLGPEAETVSILDLLVPEGTHSLSDLSQAARYFAKRVSETIGPERTLTYLMPDGTDEFELGVLRRSLNSRFETAEPLPRSIGAAFDWQSSELFSASHPRSGDLLVVIDSVGSVVSATPLVAIHNEEVEKVIPNSGGITWERCPTIQLHESDQSSLALANSVLRTAGCEHPEEIARLCGLAGAIDEGGGVSWHFGERRWYTAPHDLQSIARGGIDGIGSLWEAIAAKLEQDIQGLGSSSRIFVLDARSGIEAAAKRMRCRPVGGRTVIPVDHNSRPHAGGSVLMAWQGQIEAHPLWRDRLPQLSIRVIEAGRPKRLFLVQDSTVRPKRGHAVNIPIEETFFLAPGRTHFEFPLLQGGDGHELRYEAFLTSPAFPLDEGVPVDLELTYSYGADMPYDLVFVNKERGLRVRAEWRPRGAGRGVPGYSPNLPAPDPWSLMEAYPKRDSEETSNLLEWAVENVEIIRTRFGALDASPERGVVGSGWRTDRNGKRFTFARCGQGEVFVHEFNFVFPDDVETVGIGTQVCFVVNESPQGLRADSIIVDDGTRGRPEDVLACRQLQDLTEFMKKGPRFPFIKIWSDGRSLQDEDVPSWLVERMDRAFPVLLSVLLDRTLIDSAGDRLRFEAKAAEGALYLLCCTHRDMPEDAVDFLTEAVEEEGDEAFRPWRFCSHVAFAIGDGRLKWQRVLLSRCLDLVRGANTSLENGRDCIRVLRIALWRCPRLLDEIAVPDLVCVINQLDRLLARDVAALRGDDEIVDRRDLMDRLELTLAILRTRASEDPAISGLLGPEAEKTKEIARKVQAIVDLVSERTIPVASRVTLKLEKPAVLHNTPDLLYALLLYLTGDDSAQAIEVEAVETGAD